MDKTLKFAQEEMERDFEAFMNNPLYQDFVPEELLFDVVPIDKLGSLMRHLECDTCPGKHDCDMYIDGIEKLKEFN